MTLNNYNISAAVESFCIFSVTIIDYLTFKFIIIPLIGLNAATALLFQPI